MSITITLVWINNPKTTFMLISSVRADLLFSNKTKVSAK